MEIEDEDGFLYRDTPDILETFRKFYKNLYKTHRDGPVDFNSFFDDTEIAWLGDDQREFLLAHFEDEEIVSAIMQLQSGKAPGPDGLPDEFYKQFHRLLIPMLRHVFEEARESGILPPSMREAHVISLAKPGKSPLYCESYRPLSLINVDAKILAKLLANRITPLMTHLVLPDQSGFVPTRGTSHNLRTLFVVLQDIDPDSNAAAIFLDATKAFDSLEWDYLAYVLKPMGFPPPLLSLDRLALHWPPSSGYHQHNSIFPSGDYAWDKAGMSSLATPFRYRH